MQPSIRRRAGAVGTTVVLAFLALPALASAAPIVDSSRADFAAGTPGAGTVVTDEAGGEVQLSPTEGTQFDGPGLPSGWTSGPWTGGTALVTGGQLVVDGAYARTTALYGTGRSLEFQATFPTGTSFTHVGFGTDFTGTPWAMFSILGGTLYARTSDRQTALPASLLGSAHRYRIDWRAGGVDFLVDGVLVVTHDEAVPGPLRPIVSDYNAGGGVLAVDWLRMSPYAASGTFTSRVLDTGAADSYGTITWDGESTGGLLVALDVRSGSTPTPDGSWSAWSAVPMPGAQVPGHFRHLQYRAHLTTADTTRTPSLRSVTFTPGVDQVYPRVTITRPYDGARYSRFADPKPDLTAAYSCADDESQIASCVGTVADGAPFARSTAGTRTFTVVATDRSGLSTTRSVTYRVTDFAGIVLDDSPLAYYRLGDPEHATRMAAAAGPDGEYKNGQSGAPFGISGDGDTARIFTGADGYGYVNGITAPRSYTLSAFVRFDADGNAMVVQHGSAGAIWRSGDRLRFRPVDWHGVELSTPAGSIVTGRWYHVAGSYAWTVDPHNPQLGTGVARLYLDGLPVDSATADKATSGVSTFYVGYGDKAPWLRGVLDEVAYFPAALPATRIREIWLADPPPAGAAGTPSSPAVPSVAQDDAPPVPDGLSVAAAPEALTAPAPMAAGALSAVAPRTAAKAKVKAKPKARPKTSKAKARKPSSRIRRGR